MRLSIIIIPLIIGAITIIFAYYYIRGFQESIVLEQDVSIISVEIDRRNHILTSVTLLNEGEPLILERASLVKIQTMLTIISSKFSTPIILYKGNLTKIPLAYPLDKEGADYFLYIFTNKGTAIRFKISYP
ncbi:MAG: hypothetical protein NZ922_04570 [Candidatus Methanomethyliaceae archaeon]|nr:hypothetical protein [Candidatus Methanomethyliaceae archaeon]MDW7971101.1 hypothetical protein [Nitrososphaerota archaeon]